VIGGRRARDQLVDAVAVEDEPAPGGQARDVEVLGAEQAVLLADRKEDLDRAGYLGPLGIDAFVYRSFSGETRLKPIVEINPRYTMGRLTVELMRQVCPGSRGVFRIVSRVLAQKEGFKSLSTYAHNMNERFPIRLEGTPAPRIREGMICLNDPNRAQTCLAIFQVSRADNIF